MFFIGCNNTKNIKDDSISTSTVTQSIYKKVCIDGVYYLTSTHQLTVWVSPKDLKYHNCSDYK